MRLFRQVYRVTHRSGVRKVHAVLVEANFASEARLVALDWIRTKCPGADIELRGDPEIVRLPADWLIGEQVR